MCKDHSTTIQPLAATGLFPSLTLWGGAYTVQCRNQDVGDYLVCGRGEAECVTVSQDYHGATFYGCTCNPATFDKPSPAVDTCHHVGLVALFLTLRVAVLAGDLGRAVLRARRLLDKRIDQAVSLEEVDRACERAGLLQFWYNERRAARVKLIPRRVTEAQEAAAAPPPPAGAGLDGEDDLHDMAALFAPHACACGAMISAEASACFDCDPGQYESDRLFDVAPAQQAWFTPRPPMLSPALAGAVAELWGGAPVQVVA